MKNKIVVDINGKEYVMSADEPEEYIRKLAEYVTGKLRDAASSHLSDAETAIMACLLAADDFFKAKQDAEMLRPQIRDLAIENDMLRTENTRLSKGARQE